MQLLLQLLKDVKESDTMVCPAPCLPSSPLSPSLFSITSLSLFITSLPLSFLHYLPLSLFIISLAALCDEGLLAVD